jgi:integrase
MAKGEVGLIERKAAPTLRQFGQRFIDAISVRSAEKPRTILFYVEKLSRLLEFDPLAAASLDRIDEALIESYVQHRRKTVAPASVNRELATLRRLLRLAHEWQVVSRVARIRLLPGERVRDFVLRPSQEDAYLTFSPQPLRDVALLILETGLRVGEVLALEWSDLCLEAAPGAKFGYLRVRDGKSRNARRTVCLTARAEAMLAERRSASHSRFLFAGKNGKAFLVSSLDHQHRKVRESLRLPEDFVIHSLRHTMLTRMGEAGVDAFTIMRIAGHSSVTVSQRYVHPSSEAIQRAFERLEAFNGGALEGVVRSPGSLLPATKSATVRGPVVVSH